MNIRQIFIFGLLVFSVCTASEECTDSQQQDDEKSSGSCGCGATSRKASSESAETPQTENSEKPNYKYSKEANSGENVPRTIQMVPIPGGKFIMGTNEPVFGADGEQPARWVEIDGFFMDVYEVTNAEFQLFVRAENYVTEVCILAAL